jgi:Flp pilus assembly secretin CpaC
MDKVIFVREQQSFEPGYVVGDVALGAPEIADFRVLPGRRQLLLFGKTPGRTNLTIWDDRRAKRHEILLSVMTREEAQAEGELRDLLKSFRSVQVRWVRGRLTVIGTVPSAPDLEHVSRIAEAVGALNLVHVGRPAPPLAMSAGPGHDELLRRMLREFPGLRVGRENGQLYVSGAVKSDQDFELVRRMAAALGAQAIVNVRPDAGR